MIASWSANEAELGLVSQPLIPTGERPGLQTRIATTGSVLLCDADEKLAAFVELESAIHNASCRT
jgi:hypothetical protein